MFASSHTLQLLPSTLLHKEFPSYLHVFCFSFWAWVWDYLVAHRGLTSSYTTKENDSSFPLAINIYDGVLTGTILCIHHSGNYNCNEFMSSVVILCSNVSTPLQPLLLTFFFPLLLQYPLWIGEEDNRNVLFRVSNQQSHILSILSNVKSVL